jgi:hypothetical protein
MGGKVGVSTKQDLTYHKQNGNHKVGGRKMKRVGGVPVHGHSNVN